MNCCNNGNISLWVLIILLILGTNVLSSNAFTGCGWPVLIALVYCMAKNGTLGSLLGQSGCGCCNA